MKFLGASFACLGLQMPAGGNGGREEEAQKLLRRGGSCPAVQT